VPLIFVTNPALFVPPAGNQADFIDWGRYQEDLPFDFGGQPEFRDVTDVTQLGFGLSINNSHLTRRTQDGAPRWNGSFTQGDALLYTDHRPGPLHISFAHAIRGAATQLNIGDNAVSNFKITIRAYSATQELPVPQAGTRNGGAASAAGDGSAPWIGVLQTEANAAGIVRIDLSVMVLDPGYVGTASFAINRLKLIVSPAPPA
jgi:hypothetical protein